MIRSVVKHASKDQGLGSANSSAAPSATVSRSQISSSSSTQRSSSNRLPPVPSSSTSPLLAKKEPECSLQALLEKEHIRQHPLRQDFEPYDLAEVEEAFKGVSEDQPLHGVLEAVVECKSILKDFDAETEQLLTTLRKEQAQEMADLNEELDKKFVAPRSVAGQIRQKKQELARCERAGNSESALAVTSTLERLEAQEEAQVRIQREHDAKKAVKFEQLKASQQKRRRELVEGRRGERQRMSDQWYGNEDARAAEREERAHQLIVG